MGVQGMVFAAVLVMVGLTAYVGEARTLNEESNIHGVEGKPVIIKRSLLDTLLEKIVPEKDDNSTESANKSDNSNKPEEKEANVEDDAAEAKAEKSTKAGGDKKAKKENAKKSEKKSNKKKSLVDGVDLDNLDELIQALKRNLHEE